MFSGLDSSRSFKMPRSVPKEGHSDEADAVSYTHLFGSGATCCYNYVDLMVRNDTDRLYRLALQVGKRDLEGAWYSDRPQPCTYQIYQAEHRMQGEYWGGYTLSLIHIYYDLLVWLDAIFARGRLSLNMEAAQPRLSDRYLRLRKARHPLLDRKKAVANDLELGDLSLIHISCKWRSGMAR